MDALETVPSFLPEPKLTAREKLIFTLVLSAASVFGGNTWKSIATLASAALNGTLSEAAFADLELLLAKHGLKV